MAGFALSSHGSRYKGEVRFFDAVLGKGSTDALGIFQGQGDAYPTGGCPIEAVYRVWPPHGIGTEGLQGGLLVGGSGMGPVGEQARKVEPAMP